MLTPLQSAQIQALVHHRLHNIIDRELVEDWLMGDVQTGPHCLHEMNRRKTAAIELIRQLI